MYFRDLDLCRYSSAPTNTCHWNVPLQAIGWLEHPHLFPQGRFPDLLKQRLRATMNAAWLGGWWIGFMGQHDCSLCQGIGRHRDSLHLSAINIFLPGDGCIYVFPACILHYIEEHGYHPPLPFCRSVARCHELTGPDYGASLVKANGGPIPLGRDESRLPTFLMFE
jgi:hypothetical protein